MYLLADPEGGDGRKDVLDQESDGSAAQPPLSEGNRFEDDIVVSEERVGRNGEESGCVGIALLVSVEKCEERRGVDEDGQRPQASSR